MRPPMDSYVSYDVEDPVECLKVRPRRSSMPYYPGQLSDTGAFAVFKVRKISPYKQNKPEAQFKSCTQRMIHLFLCLL